MLSDLSQDLDLGHPPKLQKLLLRLVDYKVLSECLFVITKLPQRFCAFFTRSRPEEQSIRMSHEIKVLF